MPAELAKSLIAQFGLFDSAWYLAAYVDVSRAGLDPLEHYLNFGRFEGRKPNASFEPFQYAANNRINVSEAPFHYIAALERGEQIDSRAVNRIKASGAVEEDIRENVAPSAIVIRAGSVPAQTAICLQSFIRNANLDCDYFLLGDEDAPDWLARLPGGENARLLRADSEALRDTASILDLLAARLPAVKEVLLVAPHTICLNSIAGLFDETMDEPIYGCADAIAAKGYRLKKADYVLQEDVVCASLDYVRKNGSAAVQSLLAKKEFAPLPPAYNYLPRYQALATPGSEYVLTPESIRILNYVGLDPEREYTLRLLDIWEEEQARLADSGKNRLAVTGHDHIAYVRENSVLLLELADCHTELFPGQAAYFLNRGYNVDAVMCTENFNLNPFCRLADPAVRVYHVEQSELWKLIPAETLAKYRLIYLNTRNLYELLGGSWRPDALEFYPALKTVRDRIFCLQHHAEYITGPENCQTTVIRKLGQGNAPYCHEVFIPWYGEPKIKRYPGKPTRFIVIGSIDQKRNDFNLLVETCS